MFTPINIPGASVGNNTGFQPISFDQARQGLASVNNIATQQIQQQNQQSQVPSSMNSTGSAVTPTGGGMFSNLMNNIKKVPGQVMSIANKITAPGSGLNQAVNVSSDILATDENLVSGLTGQESIKQMVDTGANIPEPNPLQAIQGGAEIAATLPDIGAVDQMVKAGVGKASELMDKSAAAKEAKTIQDLITPKPTVKEAKIAETQGRLVKGKAPGIFTSGKPDTVLPTAQQARAAKLIQGTIPGASKMTEPELYSALDNSITSTAQKLRPEMQATPIKDATVQKITDDWTTLKARQVDDPYAPPNIQKLQSQFESFLQQSKSGNFNDLWDTAKAYDQSVPSSVKNATDLSSDAQVAQKNVWLQNRAILKDAINDTATGLGETSKPAFQNMSDMYNTQESLLTKAKIETTGQPSKIAAFSKTTPGRIIEGAIGGGAVVEGAKKLITGGF